MLCDLKTDIDFQRLYPFAQPGYSFVCYPSTIASKKFLPKPEFSNFIRIESDNRLLRVYIPESNSVKTVCLDDFHPLHGSSLQSFSNILDGISRQWEIDETNQSSESEAEDRFVSAMTAIHLAHTTVLYGRKQESAQKPPKMDSCYKKGIWRSSATWYVRIYPPNAGYETCSVQIDIVCQRLDEASTSFRYKARSVLRGNLQDQFQDFDPDKLHVPVGTHESLCMLLSFTDQNGLLLERANVSDAYLHEDIGLPIVMEQPTNSSGKPKRPGFVFLLKKSIYGAKQAGQIWGSVLHKDLLSWSFRVSHFDPEIYFLKKRKEFVILVAVVDKTAFASNSEKLLTHVKSQLRYIFNAKLYGSLRSFIRRTIRREPGGIEVDQKAYAMKILSRFGLVKCNATNKPLPNKPDLNPRLFENKQISSEKHNLYRSMIGALNYLSVCTRPNLTFSVSCLLRFLHDPCQRHLDFQRDYSTMFLKHWTTVYTSRPLETMRILGLTVARTGLEILKQGDLLLDSPSAFLGLQSVGEVNAKLLSHCRPEKLNTLHYLHGHKTYLDCAIYGRRFSINRLFNPSLTVLQRQYSSNLRLHGPLQQRTSAALGRNILTLRTIPSAILWNEKLWKYSPLDLTIKLLRFWLRQQ